MALNASNIRVGAARIYMGTTAPAVGQSLDLNADGTPTTGVEVGLTEGESVFTYEVTYVEIMAEQSLAPVGVWATAESAQIEFTMKELVNANIQDFLATLVVVTTNSAPDTDPNQSKDTFVGGRASGEVTLQSVLLVAPATGPAPNLGVGTVRYQWAMLFRAYQSDSAALRFTKTGDQLMKVTFKGIADLARTDQSTLFQVGVERYE